MLTGDLPHSERGGDLHAATNLVELYQTDAYSMCELDITTAAAIHAGVTMPATAWDDTPLSSGSETRNHPQTTAIDTAASRNEKKGIGAGEKACWERREK